VLVTGAKGFIAGYLIQELLDAGYKVIGVDNLSKYGDVEKSYDNDENYTFYESDVLDTHFLSYLLSDCDHFIVNAALIGGISYFHTMAYNLLAQNERILASCFDAAIKAFKYGKLKKITPISSSMIYENATRFPTPEGHEYECPPPLSTYGFQKLAVHYFCQGAYEQYGLPYTICIPFNAIGIGEYRAKCEEEVYSGNIKLAMSHVIPDLYIKILKGQNPLELLGCGDQIRHYTYAGDLANGIIRAMERMDDKVLNESFNLAYPYGHSVKQLAEKIWNRLNSKEFNYICVPGYKYDVQKRITDTSKAKNILGFEATTQLEKSLDEIEPWIKDALYKNLI
jgi:nucleoside-diphosphate-sugar epimerase